MSKPLIMGYETQAEWLAARRQVITATDAAKILGLSPYGGPLSVWMDKMTIPDSQAPTGGVKRRGQRMEGYLIDEYEEAHGALVQRPPRTGHWLVFHPTLPWLAATPDGIVLRGPDGSGTLPVHPPWLGVVEAKTANFSGAAGWGEDGTDIVPEAYLVQVVVQMACCDVPLATVVAAVRHLDAITFHPIQRNEARERRLIDVLAAWREKHLVRGERPELDGSEAGDAYLRRAYPADTRPALLQATGMQEAALARLRAARHTLQAAEKADEIAGQIVKDIIGDAVGLEGSAGRVTWKSNKPSEKTNQEAVIAEMTRALGEHVGVPQAQRIAAAAVSNNTTTKPGARVLRVSFPGED